MAPGGGMTVRQARSIVAERNLRFGHVEDIAAVTLLAAAEELRLAVPGRRKCPACHDSGLVECNLGHNHSCGVCRSRGKIDGAIHDSELDIMTLAQVDEAIGAAERVSV